MKKTNIAKKVLNKVSETIKSLCVPKILQGNIKTGKSIGTWSVLYGNKSHFIKKLGFSVLGTCGKNCEACQKECYVKKSYRYDSVKYRHALNTMALRQDTFKTVITLHEQLKRKRKPFEIVRINQSGEIENAKQLYMWISLAILHKETQFYIYTKNYGVLETVINSLESLPNNFTILVSIWHDIGTDTYNKYKHLPNIKAFVYDDNEYKYDFEIQTYCKAYNDRGKLDHNITCDKCKKCFNRLNSCKVIGCKAH